MKNAIEYYFVDGFGWNGHFNYSLFQCVKMECFSVHLCFLWFLSFFFFMFFKKIFLLYNVVLVLPYINMHPPRVYTCSLSWNPLPLPSPYHPSGSSQCTSPKLPVCCIEPGLVTLFLYDIIHVLMPFSQIITPPSPTESKRLFYTSVSLLCLAYRVVVTIFLNSIYMR